MLIVYRGLGYLVPVFFVAPLLIIGSLLHVWFDIYFLRSTSWLPLHSLMLLGALLTFVVGRYANRKPGEEIIYEESGPVKRFFPRHTLYYIRMEYWAVIVLVIYFGLVAYHSFR
jgi:hypothetical protein